MTQRIFDTNNEEDMTLLWSILPIEIKKLYHESDCVDEKTANIERFIQINWHDKTEITRPIQEATEADIGKLCYFWDGEINEKFIGIFRRKTLQGKYICDFKGWIFHHCRRLTKQEIEELC